MQFGMSDFTGGEGVEFLPARHRGLDCLPASPNTSRPHDPASYERDACHEQDCFGPRQ